MKSLYVRVLRAVRAALGVVGILAILDRWARRSQTGLWARSLLAVYDLEDLIRLDVPWWTFESADEVGRHLASRRDARVFEWGSGASTRWLAARAGTVTAIEHDAAWAKAVTAFVPQNARVITVTPQPAEIPVTGSSKPGHEGLDFTDYVAAIERTAEEFDLIVIDGRAREACLGAALPHLAAGGLIVFDNVDRRRYRDAIAEHDVSVTWTRGLTPCLPYPTRTALIRAGSMT